MADLALSGAATRDDRCRAAGPQITPELVCIIAAIGDEPSQPARSSCNDFRCGLQRTSVMTWIFVVWPPREMPMACAFAPLRDGPPLISAHRLDCRFQ